MSDDNNEPIHPDNINIKPYIIGTVATELTVHELKTLGTFLVALEDAPLFEDQDHLYQLMKLTYRRLYERWESGGSVKYLEKKHYRILKNTLDDLNTIFKGTGLDSIQDLIKNIKAAMESEK